jgi:Uma2 family endonuclease
MPTRSHHRIMLLLYQLFGDAVRPNGGEVFDAGLRVRIRAGAFREPDVLLLLDATDTRSQDAYWLGADLVVEVVSPDRPERDTDDKVLDYAEAGIPEYWIVNPLDETVTVLTLAGAAYAIHGVFRRGEQATSVLLDAFAVGVDAVFDAQ